MDRPGVINVANPGASLILRKPLLEEPPDHPQALFLSVTDPQREAKAFRHLRYIKPLPYPVSYISLAPAQPVTP